MQSQRDIIYLIYICIYINMNVVFWITLKRLVFEYISSNTDSIGGCIVTQ